MRLNLEKKLKSRRQNRNLLARRSFSEGRWEWMRIFRNSPRVVFAYAKLSIKFVYTFFTRRAIFSCLLIFILIFSWLFSGWPQIFNFPPKVQKAEAADTVIFTETCASNPTQPLNTSTTITVGTSWSARIALYGTPATTINSGTANCSPLADTTNIGFGYTMTPAPTTNQYYVDYVWIDGGAVSNTSGNGVLVNYIDTSNYYACMLKDDATPDAYIYKVRAGVGSTLTSNVDRTVATNAQIECRIDYSGANPVITMTNITTATQLATVTDSSSPLTKTGKAGVYCGAIPAATGDDCELSLDFDTVRLSTVPDPTAPTVTTQAANPVGDTTATCNGTITATGGANATAVGCEWDTDSGAPYANNPSTAGDYGAAPFTQSLTSLPSGTTIYARAFATNSAGTGYGSEVSFLTKPAAPTGLNFTSVTATTLRLNWTAPTGAASYKVERCTGTGCSSWAEIATGVTNAYYDDTGRTGNTIYRYQVRATNATGDGAYSSGAEQLTLPDTPGTPTFSLVTATTLRVSWAPPTGDATSYKVARCSGASCTPTDVYTGVTNTYYDDSGLTCNTLYRYKIRGTNTTGDGAYSSIAEQTTSACGTLTVDIVDAGGNPVGSPTMAMGAVPFSFIYQTADGVFGVTDQKIRVNNTTASPAWTLTIAATNGPTALWSNGGATKKYDFNDPTANAEDGSDSPDTVGGQMTINASGASLGGTCSVTDITKGSGSFSEVTPIVTNIALLTAGASANTGCYWDLTGVSVSQTVPASQSIDTYTLDLTLTVSP